MAADQRSAAAGFSLAVPEASSQPHLSRRARRPLRAADAAQHLDLVLLVFGLTAAMRQEVSAADPLDAQDHAVHPLCGRRREHRSQGRQRSFRLVQGESAMARSACAPACSLKT